MRLALGFATGWLLLALRGQPGGEVLSLPWALPSEAAGWRALALLLAGWALLPFRILFDGARPTTEYLWGVAAGVLAAGVLARLPVAGPAGPGVWVLPLLAWVLWSTSRSAGRRPAGDEGAGVEGAGHEGAADEMAATEGDAPEVPEDPPGFSDGEPTEAAWAAADAEAAEAARAGRRQGAAEWARFLSLPLLGGAVALALEALARPLARSLPADAADEAALAGTLALLVAAGAGAFGGLVSPRTRRELPTWLLPTLLATTVVSAWIGLRGLSNVLPPSALRELTARVGLDPSGAGTLAFDALIAATVLGVPAFLLGTALHGARHAREWVALATGAALATWLVPRLLDGDARTELVPVHGSLHLLATGAWCGLWGGGLAAYGTRRPWPLLAGVAGVALALLALPDHVPAPRLWQRFPREPLAWTELPAGQVMHMADGVGSANLDHTTVGAAVRADAEALEAVRARFEASFALLPDDVRERGARVLLVGQLDEPRAAMLDLLGAVRVDRCAAWWAAMGPLEEVLLDVDPAVRFEGEVLEPYEARLELAGGAYDLVLVPPLPRLCPRPRDLNLPEGTRLVLWVDGASPVAALPIDGRVLVQAEGLSGLSLGLAWPAPPAGPGLRAGAPLPAPWALERLGRRDWERDDPARARTCRRLAEANDGRTAALLEALADHFEAQRLSSPFEEHEQRVELTPATLDALRDAALSEPDTAPTPFEREVVAALARTLVGKRDVGAILSHVEPVHAAWSAGPEGARAAARELVPALVHADLESLDPELALRRLDELGPLDLQPDSLLELRARAQRQARDPVGELETRELLRARDPEDEGRERAWVRALLLADHPDGPAAAARWLAEHPDDEELRGLAAPGPRPDDADPGGGAFTPGGGEGPGASHDPDHDHGDH